MDAQSPQPLLPCPRCQSAVPFELTEFIDLGRDADAKAKLLRGTLFTAECPACGAKFLAPFPVLVHVPAMHAMVQFSPLAEGESLQDRENAMMGGLAEQQALFARFMPDLSAKMDMPLRLAISPVELFEKVSVLDAGLDDRVLEIMKLLMLRELETDPDWADVRGFLFSRVKDDEALLALDGSRRVVARFPFDRAMFDDIAGQLTFADNRHVRIDAAWAQHVLDVNQPSH